MGQEENDVENTEVRDTEPDELTTPTLEEIPAFVRKPKPRITQAPINNLAEDEEEAGIGYVHESGYTVRNHNPLQGQGYKRSRRDATKFTKDLKYGSYLEVPKGRRDLFRKAKKQRAKMVVAWVFVIAAIVAAFVACWILL